MIQNVAGVALLLTQLLLYPSLTKNFGLVPCFSAGCIVNVIVFAFFPVYGLFADPSEFGFWRYVPLATMMFIGQAAIGFCFPTMFVWVNRSLEGKDKGTWNGFTNAVAAICRSIFPPAMDALLALGLKSSLPLGRYLPVFVNAVVGFVCLVLTTATARAHFKCQTREVMPATPLRECAPGEDQDSKAA
jgi:hypothetical protein